VPGDIFSNGKYGGAIMKPLTVLFHTWPAAFDCPGGGEVQLLKNMEHLEALGVRTLRYDEWNPRPQFDQADIVHHFSMQYGAYRFCHYVAANRRLPLVISPIIWIERKERYPLGDYIALLHLADHILPNSMAECDQLAGLLGLAADRFTPVVNGVDDIFFEPADPALFRAHLGLSEPFVLCMGNIEERKNQLRLIEALAGTGLHLVLAGQEREAEYAQACRKIAGESVHFAGRLEYGGLLQRSAYAAAEVLALPSTLETPGLAALEAAAGGARLALTREGCTEEYFGDFACYLDPENVADIRTAVLEAAKKPARPELPAFIRERYTWKRAAEQLLAVYEGILAS
jgi:glycosyltransferase involved in cell wall biosynthesis